MNNNLFHKSARIALTGVMGVTLMFSGALAWGHGGGHFGHFHGGYYHSYWGWPYYYPWGTDVAVIPPIGAYVAYIPEGYATVVVGNDKYYCYNGVYFQPYSDGFVIVSPPTQSATAAAQPAATAKPEASAAPVEPKSLSSAPASSKSSDTVSVGVPNSKGGYTSVQLIKHKDGYLGPQGEFYKGHASLDQLKALYGN